MKAFKYILATIASIFLIAYLSFLFVLPNLIDMDKYSPQVTKFIEETTGFQVKVRNLKVRTSWNLSAGVLIGKADFKYPTGEKFAQINDLDIRFSLWSFFFKKVRFDSVSADKALMNIKVKSDGTFLMSEFVGKNAPKTVSLKNVKIPLTFSSHMPKISIKKYRFSFIDTYGTNNNTLKGTNLKINNFVLREKIKVTAKGIVIINGRKQITYDLNVYSEYFPKFTATNSGVDAVNIMKIFKDLYAYNLCANIKSNIRIEKDGDINGVISIKNLVATIGGNTLRPSFLNLKFDDKLINIDSEIYTKNSGKAVVNGIINNSSHKYISLKVNSDQTDIGEVLSVANTLLEVIGNKDLNGIKAKGKLNANFNIKSDFKTVQSFGFLRIENARVTYNLYNPVLDSIFANIDFSQNRVNILQSSAKLNGEPIQLKGTIDKNAFANLELNADNVQLKGVLALLCQFHFLRENEIKSGLVRLKATLTGRLDHAKPEVISRITNVRLFNIVHNTRLKLSKAAIYFYSDGKKITQGIAKFENLQLSKMNFPTVSIPDSEISFDNKDIIVKKNAFFINNSKINFFGKIMDYPSNTPNSDFTIYGLMRANDLRQMLPPQNRSGVSAIGKIPLIIKIKGKEMTEIKAQMIANNSNHLGVFDINTLRGKISLVNANLVYSQDELRIRELALYSLNTNHGLSNNFNVNIASGTKVAEMFGKITNLGYNPTLSGVSVRIPNKITTSIPGYEASNVNLKGELELNGDLFNPQITGYLTVPRASIPSIKTQMNNLVLHFNKNSTSANCRQVLLANSLVGINAEILNDFSNGITIKNLDFIANSLDLDALSAIINKNGYQTPKIRIQSGKGTVDNFKFGNLRATNITNDITLMNNSLRLSNIRGNSFYGKIGGSIIYDLNSGRTWINMQGRGLSAGNAIKAVTPQSGDVAGTLDFDSKLSTVGFSSAQIQQNLKGNTIFIISNGKMGTLGKLEHLLYAQNLIKSNWLNASLNLFVKSFAVKNTGFYKYIKGRINFNNGFANIAVIKAAGPTMSLYITGRYNMHYNEDNLIILGRFSAIVVRVLGPFGELSVNKVLSFIPNIGNITSSFINNMTTPPMYENTAMIPPLIPATQMPTRKFKVMIDGNVQSKSSVKYFKWLSMPRTPQMQTKTITSEQVKETFQTVKQRVQEGAHDVWQQVAPVRGNETYYTPPVRRQPAEFINSLPDLRN